MSALNPGAISGVGSAATILHPIAPSREEATAGEAGTAGEAATAVAVVMAEAAVIDAAWPGKDRSFDLPQRGLFRVVPF
jgi:hypothetical protein